jgi:hypothetical protein
VQQSKLRKAEADTTGRECNTEGMLGKPFYLPPELNPILIRDSFQAPNQISLSLRGQRRLTRVQQVRETAKCGRECPV